MSVWNDPELRKLFLKNTPMIDVRAPVEFLEGSIPGSQNLPILNDEERALIGTCYKEKGQEAAILLGHELVRNDIKDARISLWEKAIKVQPETEVFCFRGGLRSQITCQWLSERGIKKTPIPGGYKRLRQFFLSYIETGPLPRMIRIGGVTGSGKTRFLALVKDSVDLEKLAHHRGSSFGSMGTQPTQITFENELALAFMKNESHLIVLEDESQMIGKRQIPARYFAEMRNSPILLLKVSEAEQVQNLFNDYVLGSEKDFFLQGMERIKARISKDILTKITEGINSSFDKGLVFTDHQDWIHMLVTHYYNPLYLKDIRRQADKIVLEGTADELLKNIHVST